ncbi:MAG: ATP-grasp domain-containing protein [Ruminococcaceae bacterium]|nr:ATP-grasp domain-containing protein [Oscillospiraceae bacterium]
MKKILVIGAGYLQAFVIRKAKEMGYITLAVDANPNAVGFKYADKHAVINITDENACLAYAREEKINGVLTAATDYGVLTASYIAKELGLPGLDYEVAKTIKNKYKIRKCFYESKVDDTEQAYEINSETDLDALADKLIYPVMVKPCDGSGSRGANRVDEKERLKEACTVAMDSSITHRAVIETFIFGREYGAESLVINGEVHVLAIMKKEMTEPPYYAELGHAIPSELPPEVEKRAKECVSKAIRALGVNCGSVNMDMLITKDGKIYIVDVGARMGGNLIGSHIIPAGTGIDYMANMIRNAVGDEISLSPVCKASSVATRLLALTPGEVEKLPDFNAIEKEFDVKIEHHLAEGDIITPYRTNLDGCGYVVCLGDDAEETAERARVRIDKEIIRKAP